MIFLRKGGAGCLVQERLHTSLPLGTALWRSSGLILNSSYCGSSVSQRKNQRAADAGRNLWRSSCSISLLNKGHLESIAQHRALAFEYPQGWGLYNLSGQPVPVLGHLHSREANGR